MCNWVDCIEQSDLDLGGLTLPEFDPERSREICKKREAEQAEYKTKYGDNWFKKWWSDKNPTPDYDEFAKSVNEALYQGQLLWVHGIGIEVQKLQQRVYDRMREIFGEQWEDPKFHMPEDPHTAELLINDAIKTGKWKELPDCLQAEYHKRITNIGVIP